MFINSIIGRTVLAVVGSTAIAGGALGVAASQAHAESGDAWVTVSARGGLNVRSAPTTQAARTGHLDNGVRVLTVCRASGTGFTDGGEQWDTRWFYVSLGTGSGGWISGHFVKGTGEDRLCGGDGIRTGRTTAAVNLREAPSTSDHVVAHRAQGSTLKLRCKVTSQKINGNPRWYLTQSGHWVSAAYVSNVGPAPAKCG